MAKDNTLGAPTEGLGQTVTFALGNSGGTPQMQADQRQMLRNEARGGFAMQAKQAQFIPDREAGNTFQLLAKLGGEALKPHIEQERTAAYVRGWQRAAQKEAIREIVEEQPMFSKLFGSTSLVDGARAYTAQAKALATATELETDMPRLRQMSADEFSNEMASRLTAAKTGDPATDMILQQQLLNSMGGVAKMQAKEHLKFKVDQLNSSIDSSLTAAFAQIGAADTASRDPQSVRDRLRPLELQAQVVSQLVPPADMDPAHYDKLLAKAAGEAVRGGNFAVLNMLENSGRLQSMSADAQSYIQQAGYRARIEAKAKLPLEFAIKQAEWEDMPFDPNGNEDAITKGAEALNAEYTRLTGDTQPYLPTGTVARNLQERSRLDRAAVAARVKDIEKANKPDSKALAKAEEAMGAFGALSGGLLLNSYSKDARNAAFGQLMQTNPGRWATSVVQQAGAGNRWDDMESAMQSDISSALVGVNSQKLGQVYRERYAPIVAASGERGTAIADSYVGEHKALMQRYHDMALAAKRSGGVLNDDELFAAAVRPPPPDAPTDGKQAKAKALVSMVNGGDSLLPSFLRPDYIEPVNPKLVVDTLWQFWDKRYDDKTAYSEAIRVAETKGYTMLGGHIWKAPANATRLKSYFDSRTSATDRAVLGSDEYNRATNFTVERTAKLMNMDKVVGIQQIGDGPNGVPRMYVQGVLADGSSVISIVSGKDIEDNWAKRNDDDLKEQSRTTGNTGGTFLPKRGGPTK